MWLPFTRRGWLARRDRRRAVEEAVHPRARGVHDGARLDPRVLAVRRGTSVASQRSALALEPRAARAREHRRAVLARVHRGQHHEPRVVDPGVRVHEALRVARVERRAGRVPAQVHALGAGQPPPAREVVVEEESGADHPRRPQVRVVRQHEAQRPARCAARRSMHDLALAQRLAHQPEVVELEVAQSAVDQLGAGRRGVRGEVVLLAEQGAQARGRPHRARCRRR